MKQRWGIIFGVLGVLAAVAVYPFWETGKGHVIPGVRVAGKEVGGMSRDELETMIAAQNQMWQNRVIEVTYDRYRYPFPVTMAGLHLDTARTVDDILAYGRRGSLWQQWQERMWSRFTKPDPDWHVSYDMAQIAAWVEAFQADFAQPAQDARLDWAADGRVSVHEERPFFRFSDERLTQDIAQALPQAGVQTVALQPDEVTLPTVTASMLEGIDAVLGQYMTYFAEDGNRAANVRRAAAAVDQRVLATGEWFSFNGATGLRTESQGYLPAPVFINGELEPDFGGGVCQVSTTLFNTALLGGLEIVERTAHFAPVGYVEIGRDATVADHYLDLVVANPYAHPVCIVSRVGEGTLQIAVLGHHADQPQGVDLTQIEYRVVPHDTIEKVVAASSASDAAAAPAEPIEPKEGHDGYQVAWQRQVSWADGRTMTDSFASYYEPVTTIRVKTAPPKKEVAGDTKGEPAAITSSSAMPDPVRRSNQEKGSV